MADARTPAAPIAFETHPSRYRHWKLTVDGGVARLGLATETAAAMTHAAFTQPDIDRVEIHHDRPNIASGRIPPRLGYTFVGEETREITAPAQDGVLCLWRLTREEYERQQRQAAVAR